ncbi:hypothetical protein ABPG75_012728 [Micractinium tetrahymenae]
MADKQEELGPVDAEMVEASDGGSSGSDSSDSDSDFEEVDISPEDTKLLMRLEQALQDNPNLYDSHVQYIEVLRRCKMGARLREAWQAMHAAFPLTEQLWFDWLSDEIEGISEAEDVARILALMGEAVKDYLSVSLWAQYLEFARDLDPEVQEGGKEGQAKMRDLCERALTAAGLHVAEGGKLWGIYRGYEQALLDAAPSEEQTERVRSLWARQLQVPLAGAADTLAAYEAWERSLPGGQGWQLPAALRQGYERAVHAAGLRQPYEDSVAAGREAGPELLAAYMAYIKVEERQGDPARVQVAYERAVAAFPVTHYLWAQYARYLEANLKIGSVVNSVYARAVRNCPWVGQLWGRALRALERSGAPEEQHAAMYEKALTAGLQSYEDYLEPVLARLDCLRRRGAGALPTLRATFPKASQLLQSYFPDQLDRTFRLTSYWADCEAGLGGDLKAARAVWEAALKGAAGRYADTWAAYINFERRRGNAREARTLYKRSYSRRLEEGGQAVLCDAWLRFEREEGSAEDHLAACFKVEPILQELQAAAAAAADPQQHAAARSAAEQAPKLSKEEVRAMRQKADPNYGKRKAQQAQQGEQQEGNHQEQAGAAGDMPPPPAKKPRKAEPVAAAPVAAAGQADGAAAAEPAPSPAPQQQEQEQEQQAAPQAEEQEHGAGQPAPSAKTPAGQQQQQQQQAEVPQQQGQQQQAEEVGHGQQRSARPQWRQQRRTDSNTAFVKHLADGVNEPALQELFGGCGEITGIEIGREKQTGRPKGFAYIHFATREGLEAACQLDRAEYRGKHIFVAPSKPPGAGGSGQGQAPGQQQQGQQAQQAQQAQHQQQHGGRGGRGRGGRDGGRGGRDGGRGGRDGGRGRGGGRGGRGAPGPKHRSMIDLGEEGGPSAAGRPASGGGLRGFVPRAAALGGQQRPHAQQEGGGGGAAAAGDAPKSNADFRAMFLKK